MDKNCSNVSLLATRLLLEDNYESPICHGAINGNGSSTWWCCYPSSACASQTAGLYDRHQRGQRPGALCKGIRFAAQKSVKDHGGEYVAAGPGTQVAGNLPHGPVVILRWESMEALQSWRNSPEFQAALKIGEKYAKFNIVAVNGLK